jgi:hypothetical protein
MRTTIALAFLLAGAGAAHAQARCADGSLTWAAAACARHGGVVNRAALPGEKVLQLPAYPTLSCEDGTTTTETGADACRGHGGLGAPQRRAPDRANGYLPTEPTD